MHDHLDLGPSLPSRAYMITKSLEDAKSRKYTLDGIARMANVLGFQGPVEVVLGIYTRPSWCNITCDESKDVCQVGTGPLPAYLTWRGIHHSRS